MESALDWMLGLEYCLRICSVHPTFLPLLSQLLHYSLRVNLVSHEVSIPRRGSNIRIQPQTMQYLIVHRHAYGAHPFSEIQNHARNTTLMLPRAEKEVNNTRA